jgi:hypothetical protein
MHVGRFRHSHIALGRKKWPRSNIPHIVTLNTYAFSNAAEEEIASRSEAISDGAERVLKFSILYMLASLVIFRH